MNNSENNKNKICPNCGYEYSENLAICPICSNRLDFDQRDVMNEAAKDEMLDNMDIFASDDEPRKFYTQRLSFRPFGENVILNFATTLVIISLLLWSAVFLIVEKHNDYKAKLEFKNLILNPEKIPELKEPTSYLGLKSNLADVEKFLGYYLKYSNDSAEKKEEIFISYLKEMDKLPYVTTDNFVNNLNYCSGTNPRNCALKLTHEFRDVGILAFSNYNTMYLYPDYRFIEKNIQNIYQASLLNI